MTTKYQYLLQIQYQQNKLINILWKELSVYCDTMTTVSYNNSLDN